MVSTYTTTTTGSDVPTNGSGLSEYLSTVEQCSRQMISEYATGKNPACLGIYDILNFYWFMGCIGY